MKQLVLLSMACIFILSCSVSTAKADVIKKNVEVVDVGVSDVEAVSALEFCTINTDFNVCLKNEKVSYFATTKGFKVFNHIELTKSILEPPATNRSFSSSGNGYMFYKSEIKKPKLNYYNYKPIDINVWSDYNINYLYKDKSINKSKPISYPYRS